MTAIADDLTDLRIGSPCADTCDSIRAQHRDLLDRLRPHLDGELADVVSACLDRWYARIASAVFARAFIDDPDTIAGVRWACECLELAETSNERSDIHSNIIGCR